MSLSLNKFALVSRIQLDNVLYCVNGKDEPWMTDGLVGSGRAEYSISTTAPCSGDMGNFIPTSGDITGEIGGDNLLDPGTYDYVVTYVRQASSTYPRMESGASDFDGYDGEFTVEAVGSTVFLSGLPVSDDPQVDQRAIYRTGGPNTYWYRVGTVDDNTTLTFTDNMTNKNARLQEVLKESAGAEFPLKRTCEEGTWPTGDYLEVYENRIWMTSGDLLYFSEAQPYHEDLPSTNALRASTGR